MTVIYGVILAGVTWQSIPKVENLPFENGHLKLLSDRTLELLSGKLQPKRSESEPDWKKAPLVLEMPNGYKFEVQGNTTKDQAQEIARDYAQALKSTLQEKQIEAIKSATLWWLTSCLSLLVLGWTIGWVCRGFKQRSE